MKTPNMHAPIWLLVLTTTVYATSQALTCIGEDEVEGITHRWLNAFSTGGIDGLPNAVTDNVCNFVSRKHELS